jgi:hypothetical protein
MSDPKGNEEEPLPLALQNLLDREMPQREEAGPDPYVDDDLIGALEGRFPEMIPGDNLGLGPIQRYLGRRDVVLFIKDIYSQQEKSNVRKRTQTG